ncbi:MAG: membrane integrity-associated transporter subunit PqiC [Candidatus Aminicenantes bacterium]|nr:membrane integrity-associated transporter subunit PqiC [Candidatus Aminicenantes bacterium]
MRKAILIACIVLAGAGCFASHAKRYFELGYPAPGPEEPTFDKTILFDRVDVEELYDDFRIIYRISPTEVNYYAYNFWAEKPSKTIRNLIRERLIIPGRFIRVDLETSPDSTDWILQVKVFRIEEVDEAERWHARLAMDFDLVETGSNMVIASHTFDRTEPLADKRPGLLAGALSKILAEEFDAFLRTWER